MASLLLCVCQMIKSIHLPAYHDVRPHSMKKTEFVYRILFVGGGRNG